MGEEEATLIDRILREQATDKDGKVDDSKVRVKIRSVLTCDARKGVCACCYGANLATTELVTVGEAVAGALKPLQAEFDRLSKDKAYVESVYKKGAETANYLANKTLRKVYKKVGFIPR